MRRKVGAKVHDIAIEHERLLAEQASAHPSSGERISGGPYPGCCGPWTQRIFATQTSGSRPLTDLIAERMSLLRDELAWLPEPE